jgi:hypothetical protein
VSQIGSAHLSDEVGVTADDELVEGLCVYSARFCPQRGRRLASEYQAVQVPDPGAADVAGDEQRTRLLINASRRRAFSHLTRGGPRVDSETRPLACLAPRCWIGVDWPILGIATPRISRIVK